MNKTLVIGIAGGSGSGKSKLTENIKNRFGDDVTVVLHDYYYNRLNNMTYEERCQINYDEPAAYETDWLIRDLALLKQGKKAVAPVYDFTIHNRSDQTQEILPTKVIVVEGILVLSDPRLCDLFDLKVFVDTDADIRIIRRIRRDMVERARSFDSIVNQYMTTVKPMHEKYVEPSKKNADIVIPHGGNNTAALDLLYRKIDDFIHGVER